VRIVALGSRALQSWRSLKAHINRVSVKCIATIETANRRNFKTARFFSAHWDPNQLQQLLVHWPAVSTSCVVDKLFCQQCKLMVASDKSCSRYAVSSLKSNVIGLHLQKIACWSHTELLMNHFPQQILRFIRMQNTPTNWASSVLVAVLSCNAGCTNQKK
jgi:hypothetical protein